MAAGMDARSLMGAHVRELFALGDARQRMQLQDLVAEMRRGGMSGPQGKLHFARGARIILGKDKWGSWIAGVKLRMFVQQGPVSSAATPIAAASAAAQRRQQQQQEQRQRQRSCGPEAEAEDEEEDDDDDDGQQKVQEQNEQDDAEDEEEDEEDQEIGEGAFSFPRTVARGLGRSIAQQAGAARVPAPDGIPSAFVCPLGNRIMVDPVLLVDSGNTYERQSVEWWLRQHRTDPKTNDPVVTGVLVRNHALRHAIHDYVTHCPTALPYPTPRATPAAADAGGRRAGTGQNDITPAMLAQALEPQPSASGSSGSPVRVDCLQAAATDSSEASSMTTTQDLQEEDSESNAPSRKRVRFFSSDNSTRPSTTT